MKNSNIEEYDFIDCMFVDLGVNKLLSTLFVTVEAYFPSEDKNKIRKKGLIKLEFVGINQLTISKSAEFDFDLKLPYDAGGNDVRANEIYSIKITDLPDNRSQCTLESDMLNFNVTCREIKIMEI